jgi:hypothetical protein
MCLRQMQLTSASCVIRSLSVCSSFSKRFLRFPDIWHESTGTFDGAEENIVDYWARIVDVTSVTREFIRAPCGDIYASEREQILQVEGLTEGSNQGQIRDIIIAAQK